MNIAVVDEQHSNINPFTTYPEYRDPGIKWLGQIPVHWQVKRLKNIVEINPNSLPETTRADYELQYIDISNVDSNGEILAVQEMIFANSPSRARRIVQNGDTIVSTVRTYLRAIAFIKNPPKNLIVSTGFAVLRPLSKILPEFLFRIAQSDVFVEKVVAYSEGVSYPAIAPNRLAALPVWLPPLDEQLSIVKFLSDTTAKIDTLIAKKERLIALLEERRSAVITQAVTKGLNSNAPMKDSGVTWLGDVPQHWTIKRFKYLTSEPLKYGANEAAELQDTNLPRFVRITDIDEKGMLRDETFRSLPEDVARPYLLQQGDLLFARSGATVGKTFLYDESWGRACYAGYLIRARLNQKIILPKFVSYFVSSRAYWDWVSSIFIQATIQNISAEKYANLSMATPSIKEQQGIIDFLDSRVTYINNIISRAQRQIKRLREYRTALITMAVTGKIDVRSYQKQNV